jgi:hypothetical protein
VQDFFVTGEIAFLSTCWTIVDTRLVLTVFHSKHKRNCLEKVKCNDAIAIMVCWCSHTEGSKCNIPCCALLGRQKGATFACCTRATWRTSYTKSARNICMTYAPDSRRMRASHPRIRRKCCAHLLHEERATRDHVLLDPSVSNCMRSFGLYLFNCTFRWILISHKLKTSSEVFRTRLAKKLHHVLREHNHCKREVS